MLCSEGKRTDRGRTLVEKVERLKTIYECSFISVLMLEVPLLLPGTAVGLLLWLGASPVYISLMDLQQFA